MIGRLALPILSLLLLLGAAVLALGLPDLGLAATFFVDYPTMASSLAAAQVLVWVLIGIGGLWTLTLAIQEIQHSSGPVQRRFWEASALVIGILVLAAGAGRDFTYQFPMYGGTIAQAHQALEDHPIGSP
jgi:hypothetical protein